MGLIVGRDELGGDAHPLTGPTYAPLEHVVHSELTSNLGDILLRAFVVHGGGARYHAEMARVEAAELGDQLFGHTVRKVVPAWVAAEVLERQHSQHDLMGRRLDDVQVGECEGEDDQQSKSKPADARC